MGGAEEDGGGGGGGAGAEGWPLNIIDGLRDPGGAGGFFPIGGGGPLIDADDEGLCAVFAVLRKLAIEGTMFGAVEAF